MELSAGNAEFAGCEVFEFADALLRAGQGGCYLSVRQADEHQHTDPYILFVESLLLKGSCQAMEELVGLMAESGVVTPRQFLFQVVGFA